MAIVNELANTMLKDLAIIVSTYVLPSKKDYQLRYTRCMEELFDHISDAIVDYDMQITPMYVKISIANMYCCQEQNDILDILLAM